MWDQWHPSHECWEFSPVYQLMMRNSREWSLLQHNISTHPCTNQRLTLVCVNQSEWHIYLGDSEQQMKSPPSLLPLENDLTICPCMFMMTTLLVLLHTTIWSMFLGITWTLLMWTSPPAAPPRLLNVFWHSVVLVFHTFTVPSLEALNNNIKY